MAILTDVAGIGPVSAKVLTNHRIKTPEALAAADITDLEKIPGFSHLRATTVIKAAKDCLLSNKKTSTGTRKQSAAKNATNQDADASVPKVLLNTATQNEKQKKIKSNKKEKSKSKKKIKEKINVKEKARKKNKIKKEKNKDKIKKAKKKS